MNFIADIPNGTFRDLAKLTHLYMSKNRLSRLNVGTFDPLKNIRKIDIFQNNLTLLEDGIFLKNEYLFEINLNQNHIFAIGPKAFYWEKLERLDLKENFCADIEIQFSMHEDRLNYLTWHTKCIHFYPHFVEIYKMAIESSEKLTYCKNETNFFQTELKNQTGLLKSCHVDMESISKKKGDLEIEIDDCKRAHVEEANKLQELFWCKENKTLLTEKLEKINQKEVSNCTSAIDENKISYENILKENMSPPFIIFISIIILETVTILIITICWIKKCKARPTFYDDVTAYYSSQIVPPMLRSRDSNLYATPYDIDQLNVGPNEIPLYAQVNKPKALKTQLDL
jgi:hypothetical protein